MIVFKIFSYTNETNIWHDCHLRAAKALHMLVLQASELVTSFDS